MLMAHPAVLDNLVEQYEVLRVLHAEDGSPKEKQRMDDVAYTPVHLHRNEGRGRGSDRCSSPAPWSAYNRRLTRQPLTTVQGDAEGAPLDFTAHPT